MIFILFFIMVEVKGSVLGGLERRSGGYFWRMELEVEGTKGKLGFG